MRTHNKTKKRKRKINKRDATIHTMQKKKSIRIKIGTHTWSQQNKQSHIKVQFDTF